MSKLRNKSIIEINPRKNQETGRDFKINPASSDIYKWHSWLAWYPIYIKGRWIWLKFVKRKRIGKMRLEEEHYVYEL